MLLTCGDVEFNPGPSPKPPPLCLPIHGVPSPNHTSGNGSIEDSKAWLWASHNLCTDKWVFRLQTRQAQTLLMGTYVLCGFCAIPATPSILSSHHCPVLWDSISMPDNGRGSLLTCGDVEENLGPPPVCGHPLSQSVIGDMHTSSASYSHDASPAQNPLLDNNVIFMDGFTAIFLLAPCVSPHPQ